MNNEQWSDSFAVAAASVAGHEHRRLHRNNQDGLAVRAEPQRIVAALCDGCSAGRFSEVGARLAAAWVVARLPELLADRPTTPTLCARLTDGLTDYLRQIAAGLGGGALAVHDHLLFTLLVAVVEPERSLILGLGDGLYSVDGKRRTLDSGPDNAPPYLGYRLIDPAQLDRPSNQSIQISHEGGPVYSLALGSDGSAGFDWAELDQPRYARNRSLLQKRLNVLERQFADDASLILIRRVSAS